MSYWRVRISLIAIWSILICYDDDAGAGIVQMKVRTGDVGSYFEMQGCTAEV